MELTSTNDANNLTAYGHCERVLRVEPAQSRWMSDDVAREEPLEIRLVYGPAHDRREKAISVTMRTPGHDAELAVGFLLTEGVVRDGDDVASTEDWQNTIRIVLPVDVEVNEPTLQRNFYTTSSCGICGKASLLALQTACPPRRENSFILEADVIRRLPEKLGARQEVFRRTGGLHAAALVNQAGELYRLREDVGRHNAVDKLVGAAAMADELPLRQSALLLSGRVSFELMQKAVMASIPMVIAIGAPSSLAIELARNFDLTLIGFLREDQFNVYHGASRVGTLVV